MRKVIAAALAGALAGLAGAASAQDWAGAPRVEVEMWNFKFEPEALEMKSGQPYVLHLVNASDSRQDFTAKAFFAAANVAAEDRSAIVDGKVEVAPNSARDIRVVAPASGQYEARCSRFLRAHLGMKTEIAVR